MTLFETLRGEAGRGSDGPRRQRTAPVRFANQTVRDLHFELRPLRACAEIEGAWRDLARRSLEPNVFHEPEFALAAAQHLIGGDNLSAILIWDQRQATPRLLGLLPVMLPERRLFASSIRGIDNSYGGSGVPLVDRTRAESVLALLIDWLASADAPASALTLPRLDPEGPFASALLPILRRRQIAVEISARRQRPAIFAASIPETADHPGAVRLATLTRALSSKGKPTIISAKSGPALRDAVEIYLAMEASGEQGRDGTAMMLRTRTGAFLRAATRGLGHVAHCEVLTLMLEGQALASAILYGSGNRATLVHLTADERHAAFSPAEILLLTIAGRQAKGARAKQASIIECGLASHFAPVEQSWQDRVIVVDIAFDARKRATARPAGSPTMSLATRTSRYLTRLVRQARA